MYSKGNWLDNPFVLAILGTKFLTTCVKSAKITHNSEQHYLNFLEGAPVSLKGWAPLILMLKLQNSQVFLTFLLYDETLQGALDKAGFTNLLRLVITEQFLCADF